MIGDTILRKPIHIDPFLTALPANLLFLSQYTLKARKTPKLTTITQSTYEPQTLSTSPDSPPSHQSSAPSTAYSSIAEPPNAETTQPAVEISKARHTMLELIILILRGVQFVFAIIELGLTGHVADIGFSPSQNSAFLPLPSLFTIQNHPGFCSPLLRTHVTNSGWLG